MLRSFEDDTRAINARFTQVPTVSFQKIIEFHRNPGESRTGWLSATVSDVDGKRDRLKIADINLEGATNAESKTLIHVFEALAKATDANFQTDLRSRAFYELMELAKEENKEKLSLIESINLLPKPLEGEDTPHNRIIWMLRKFAETTIEAGA